jgi:hypothetical protein
MSKTADGIYMLYTNADIEVDGWRIAQGDVFKEPVENILPDFAQRGFYSWDISLDSDKVWYLLLSGPDMNFQNTAIDVYPFDEQALKKNVTEKTTKGWVPSGLMMEEDKIYIQYRK